ncbi:MAG: hypothetical protein ACLSB9_35830 [Hydrogeniiclostridium mannosilyticum]
MGRKALCQKHFETLRPLLFHPKKTLQPLNRADVTTRQVYTSRGTSLYASPDNTGHSPFSLLLRRAITKNIL